MNINKIFAKKSLGQNFIHDKNFLNKISLFIKSDKNTTIIEIGPGTGALTEYLIKKKYRYIFLIEKDKVLSELLKKQFIDLKNVSLLNEDALNIDYNIFNKSKKVIIVGNLPFNISTQLFLKWITEYEWPPFYEKMILMFQKEVAERIISLSNKKTYSRISVLAQARCKVKKLMYAPATIFSPKPKVDAMILEFTPKLKYEEIDIFKLQKVAKMAFELRRKKIKTSLKEYSAILDLLKIDQNLRAENLSVDNYCKISSFI